MTTIDGVYRIAGAHGAAALLHAAHAAGVFEYLRQPAPAHDVAIRVGWIEWKTQTMLHALVAQGFLSKNTDGRFKLTEASERFLVSSSPEYIGDFVELLRRQWAAWGQIAAIMSIDRPHPSQQDLTERNGDLVDVFQRAMAQTYMQAMPPFIDLPVWRTAKIVFDIAGGHGLHLCTVAARYRDLGGEVWDYPASRDYAVRNFRRYGLTERLAFREIDLREVITSELPAADVVMLNHCIHHFLRSELEHILQQASEVLRPDGTLLILEEHLDDSECSPPEAALFSFGLMINNPLAVLHPTSCVVTCVRQLFSEVNVLAHGDERLIVGHRRRRA
jgi:SAM-dependent methyltransferase